MKSFLQRLFASIYSERQFYMRHEGEVQFVSVAPAAQLAIVILLALFLLWTIYSSTMVFFQQDQIGVLHKKIVLLQSHYEERLERMQESHDALNARLSLAKDYFEKTTENLEERHKHIATIMSIQDKMGLEIRKRREALRKARQEKKNLRNKDLEGRVFPKLEKGEDLGFLALSSRPIDSSEILPSTTGWEPGRWLDERDRREDWRYLLSGEGDSVDEILPTLHGIGLVQTVIIDHFEESTKQQIVSFEEALQVIALMDSQDLTARFARPEKPEESEPISLGGPFIPLDRAPLDREPLDTALDNIDPSSDPSLKPLSQRIGSLRETMRRLEKIQKSFLHLPISPPMDGYHITSNFGPRMDPFTQRWADHLGLDMVSTKRAQVYAVLPGTVIFAGKRKGFGNLVEIRHAKGFVTRYGHLKEIYVEKKESVDFRSVLGMVGNSGRSTGEHLHFEILLDDKSLDPLKFLEAGKYVYKI